jgi:hypothetical protein
LLKCGGRRARAYHELVVEQQALLRPAAAAAPSKKSKRGGKQKDKDEKDAPDDNSIDAWLDMRRATLHRCAQA